MAVSTVDFNIRPEDGWVLVATNPTYLNVRPDDFAPWWVAVTAGGAPALGLTGQQFGRGGGDNSRQPFILPDGITGEVYIRIQDPAAVQPVNQTTHFGVIANVA